MRGRQLKGVLLGIAVATLSMSAIAEELMIEEVIVTELSVQKVCKMSPLRSA